MASKFFNNPNSAAETINSASRKSEERKKVEVAQHNARFVQGHKQAVAAWRKSHPGKPLPVAKDKDGKLHWVGRGRRK